MSTQPTSITTSGVSGTLANILKALASVNGYVQLGMLVGEELIPIGKALIGKITAITTGPTVDYTVELKIEQADLDSIVSGTVEGITAINAELARQGAQLVILPPTTTPPPVAPAPAALTS